MRRPAAVFPIALALAAMGLVPRADAGEPTKIKECQTIAQPGSYELVANLNAGGRRNPCLFITADDVTIDLAGFFIFGDARTGPTLVAGPGSSGIAVRNGSIAGGVDLGSADGSIVEGLRVS